MLQILGVMWPKKFNLVSGSIHVIMNLARSIIFIVFSPGDNSTSVHTRMGRYRKDREAMHNKLLDQFKSHSTFMDKT